MHRHTQWPTLPALACRRDRKTARADLPEYTSKLQRPVICSTVTAPGPIDCKTPAGYLIDKVKRPLSAVLQAETVDKIFLDIEKIYCQSTLLREDHPASVLDFLDSVELELAALFAMYPRNLDALQRCNKAVAKVVADAGGLQQIQSAFAAVVSIPDALLHRPSSSAFREPLWRLMGKRGAMKELLAERDALFEELFYCRYADEELREEVLNTVLPYFDKGATIDDTMGRLCTCWSVHVLKVQTPATGWKKALRVSGRRGRAIFLFAQHLVVFKLHSRECKEFEYYVPLDAVRLTASDGGLLTVCVPHRGMVKDYKVAGEAQLASFVARFHDLCSTASVDAAAVAPKPANKQPMPQERSAKTVAAVYKSIVRWPEPVIPGVVRGTLATLSGSLDAAKCWLYKFDPASSSWCPCGRSVLRVELSDSTSSPVMVVRSAENGLVRLSVRVDNAVVEFYPQSFSLYDITEKSGKANVFQVKLADAKLLQSARDLFEHVRLKADEGDEWRRLDRIPASVLLDISECTLTASFHENGPLAFDGQLRVLSGGKFEFNHESMLIGWICDCEYSDGVHVVVHGAILGACKKIQWCTMVVTCYNAGTAKTLFGVLHEQTAAFEGDLVDFLDSYGRVEQSPTDKGHIYEDSLCINDIFAEHEPVDCRKAPSLSFGETPAGRLIEFGLYE